MPENGSKRSFLESGNSGKVSLYIFRKIEFIKNFLRILRIAIFLDNKFVRLRV